MSPPRYCVACGERLPRGHRYALCGSRGCARRYPHVWRADRLARRAQRTASAAERAYCAEFHAWAQRRLL